jgi:hypothetical protein
MPSGFERCRVCKHSYISHLDFEHKFSKCQYIVNGACSCEEFFPTDNLKFLEYKYARYQ